jgi:hypothetical protein
MAGEIRREEGSYRRGLVMGLTMAEVMVLIVFCLLLLLGGSLATRSEAETAASFAELRPALMEAAGYAASDPIPDDFVELVRAGREVRDQLKAAGLGSNAQTVEQVVRLGREAQEALGTNTMSKDSAVAAREFIRQAAAAYEDAKESRPHGSSSIWLESTLRSAASCEGNGLEFPPCARTPDGRPALVFTATLSSNAITLHDNQVPGLESARASWPLTSIAFDTPLSVDEFLASTKPMFDWSVERACRFVVLVADQTGAAEKTIYKTRLRTVERHFYKHEPLQRQGS